MSFVIISKKKIIKSMKFIPFIKYNLIKDFFLKKKKSFKIYKLSLLVFKFFNNKNILLYNGKKFINFKFVSLKLFSVIGEFITTRIVNFGRVLHKRKKK